MRVFVVVKRAVGVEVGHRLEAAARLADPGQHVIELAHPKAVTVQGYPFVLPAFPGLAESLDGVPGETLLDQGLLPLLPIAVYEAVAREQGVEEGELAQVGSPSNLLEAQDR